MRACWSTSSRVCLVRLLFQPDAAGPATAADSFHLYPGSLHASSPSHLFYRTFYSFPQLFYFLFQFLVLFAISLLFYTLSFVDCLEFLSDYLSLFNGCHPIFQSKNFNVFQGLVSITQTHAPCKRPHTIITYCIRYRTYSS